MNSVHEDLALEPALAWKVAVNLRESSPDSSEAKQASQTVRSSPLVQQLLASRDATGHAYSKWTGSHWILSLLADLGYPTGDPALQPLMEETYQAWLSPRHEEHIHLIDGRTRRCASQEGNAAWSSLRLGLADDRTQELVARLIKWQWPDGGWNCDRRPQAINSSFMESLIPLRALALYAHQTGDPKASKAAEKAAEVFLKRQLFLRLRDGLLMDPHFLLLHYPPYWHYDILFGLKVMTEAGFIQDSRCEKALDTLAAMRLPDGGFPAGESYSRNSKPGISGYTPVRWGSLSKSKMNPFVTADALFVLQSAGRLAMS
jgi:hypothetical protein